MDESSEIKGKRALVPKRYIIVGMCFFGLLNALQMRSSLPVAITQMVEPTPLPEMAADVSICPKPVIEARNTSVSSLPTNHDVSRFVWSQEIQGVILSAFFYGYAASHIPAGLLVQRIGAKAVLLSCVLFSAIVSIITPIGIELGGASTLIALRILMGLAQGGLFPSIAALVSAWIPINERGLLSGIAYNGTSAGIIVGTFFSGMLLHHFEGWHSAFYVFGIIGLGASVIVGLFCYNNPEEHPYIDEYEKQHLRKELRPVKQSNELPPTPWKEIFMSPAVLALICAQMGHDFAFYVVFSDLPKYMNDVLHISIKDNGLYSSIPQASRVMLTFLCGFACDALISTGRLSITNARKFFLFVASIFPGVFIVLASYAGCNEFLVVLSFAISVGSQGAMMVSGNINAMDLTPNYAGPLTGLINGSGAISGILAPYVVGLMTPNSLLIEWRMVFWLTFGLHMIKATVFTIWGSGKAQPFDNIQRSSEDNDEPDEMKKLTKTSS